MQAGSRIPPSAMIGTPKVCLTYLVTSKSVVASEGPTGLPGPEKGSPTSSASAPASARHFACRQVLTRPAMTSMAGCLLLISLRNSTASSLTPSSVSRHRTSTPASTKAFRRSSSFARRAAATRSCLLASLDAEANARSCLTSPRQIRATISFSLFRIGSFATLSVLMKSLASRSVTGSWTNFTSVVMMLSMFALSSSAASRSRAVTRPTSLPPILPFPVTGMPPQPSCRTSLLASITVARGPSVCGFRMKPCW
mmetsp:Transcript_64770/g.189963  ORF Transcript_64770/g.189963 Transcript_64770/m.189963 type:complete len:254 (+) Transcript_64770:398-1159(+)